MIGPKADEGTYTGETTQGKKGKQKIGKRSKRKRKSKKAGVQIVGKKRVCVSDVGRVPCKDVCVCVCTSTV